MLLLRRSRAFDSAATAISATRLPRALAMTAGQPGPQLSSGEVWRSTVAQGFRREGSVFVTVYNAPPEPPGDTGVQQPDTANIPYLPFNLPALQRVVRLIRDERIEIVNWHFLPALTNPYVWALTLLCPRVRHWMTEHISPASAVPAPTTALERLVKRALLSRYEKILCVSGFVAGYLALRGYPRTTTSHMFVDTDRFRPDPRIRADVRARLGLGERFVAVFTSHLIPEKGGSVAIEAIQRLSSDAVLLVVGDGPDAPALMAQVKAAGLGDQVRFLDRQTDVTSYMQAADALVCPSLWAEAAGLVNMEAQACGLPVVASRIGGIPEIVEDGRTGLLVKPGDPEAMARALARLRDDPVFADQLSIAARARMIEHFSIASSLPAYLDLHRTTR